MNKITKLPILALIFFFIALNPILSKAAFQHYENNLQEITTDNFYKNSEQENVKTVLDKKTTLKTRLGIRLAKKQLKKQQKINDKQTNQTGKNQFLALLLCIFLGGLGIHRFYLGYTIWGLIYLCTGGLFGIGWIIDIILLLLPNGLTPKGTTQY